MVLAKLSVAARRAEVPFTTAAHLVALMKDGVWRMGNTKP